MMYAKLSTAITIPFGPVLDSAGAEYTGAVVGDVKICKNNGTPAALNGGATLTHKEVGIYELVLTTSDISAVGQATLTLSKTTYVAGPVTLIVLTAKVYDSLVGGTSNLEIDVIKLLGTAWLAPAVAGTPDVNAKQVGGTSQTGLDLGANWTAARAAHLDVDVSSRMATYTQPTGFLAEDFTELDADIEAIQTGVAAIPTNPYTGTPPTTAQIATAIFTDTTASDFTVALSFGKSVMNGVSLGTGLTVANLTNAPTAGDFTATMKTSIDTEIDARLEAFDPPTNAEMVARTLVAASYGTAANQTTIINAVNAVTTNTARSAPRVPDFLPRPSAGSTAYVADLYLYSLQGQLEDADANTVTVHARNAANVSLDAGLTSTTMTRVSVGKYRLTYTVASGDTTQAVYFDFTWQVNAANMADGAATQVQDAENYAFLSAIKTKTDQLTFTGGALVQADVVDWKGATAPAMTGDAYAEAVLVYNRIGAPAGASIAADIAEIEVETDGIGSPMQAGATVVLTDGSLTTTKLGTFVLAKTTNLTGLNDIAATAIVSAGAITTSGGKVSGVITVDALTANNDKTGYALTAGERDSIAAALLDLAAGVETGRTPRQALRLMLASMCGKLSGAATNTVSIRDTNDTKNRIVGSVDADGNRTAVVLDAT